MKLIVGGFAFLFLCSLASCLQYQVLTSWSYSGTTCSAASTGYAVKPTDSCSSPYNTCSNVAETLGFDAKTACVDADPLSPDSVSADVTIYKFWDSSDSCQGPYTVGFAITPSKCILGGINDAAYKLSGCIDGSVIYTRYVYIDYCLDNDVNFGNFSAPSGVCIPNGVTSQMVYCPGDIIPPMAPVTPPIAPPVAEPVAEPISVNVPSSEPVSEPVSNGPISAEQPNAPTSSNVPQSSGTPQKSPNGKASDVTQMTVGSIMLVMIGIASLLN